jgi:hypothetical protein
VALLAFDLGFFFVNRTAIAAFRTRAAAEIADSLGTLIQIGTDTAFYAFVSTPSASMNLIDGGFNTDKSIRVRWPQTRAARPAVGTKLTLVQENVTYRVETSTSLPGSPLSAEVLVTAIRE